MILLSRDDHHLPSPTGWQSVTEDNFTERERFDFASVATTKYVATQNAILGISFHDAEGIEVGKIRFVDQLPCQELELGDLVVRQQRLLGIVSSDNEILSTIASMGASTCHPSLTLTLRHVSVCHSILSWGYRKSSTISPHCTELRERLLTAELADEVTEILEEIERLEDSDEDEPEKGKFELLMVAMENLDELNHVLSSWVGPGRRAFVDGKKANGVDETIYHGGSIVGRHCEAYGKRILDIFDVVRSPVELDEKRRVDFPQMVKIHCLVMLHSIPGQQP